MSEDKARLYLATPAVADPDTFLPTLRAALEAADVASLLLRLAKEGPVVERIIRAVTALAQPLDVAVLTDGAPDLVARCKADGAHLPYDEKRIAAALAQLQPDYIVGVGGLASRDAAMWAGEAGVDYLLFGDVGETEEEPALDWIVERVSWWAEIFNTPCVALARRLDEVEPLSAAGADFVMLDEAVWSDPRGPAEAIRDAAARIVVRRS